MRDFARIAPSFWIRGSGRKLRGEPVSQLVALYLLTCPASNMVGIFYLPIPTICHETAFTEQQVRDALVSCERVQLAWYDEDSELVWVPNMARYQLGNRLNANDTAKRTGVINAIRGFASHPFYKKFVELYNVPYGLGLTGAVTPTGAVDDKALESQSFLIDRRTGPPGCLLGANRVSYARARSLSPSPDPDPDLALVRSDAREEGVFYLRDDWTLTPERRAYAELVPLTDVPAVFKKFQQIAVEKTWAFDSRGWDARWMRFCDDEAGYQRRARESARRAPERQDEAIKKSPAHRKFTG